MIKLTELASVRCEKCGKLLFTIKQDDDVYIECKCPKCKTLNKIYLYL